MCGSVEKEYEKFFERVAGRVADSREERRLFYRVLGAFASARAPVTAEQIMAAFDLDRADFDWAFGQIGQFLERGGVRQEERGAQTYRLYHETFREYLRSRLAGDLPGYHRRWADHAAGWRNLRGYARLYALRHLPAHLIAAGEGPEPPWDRLCDALTDFAFLQAKIGADNASQSESAPATIYDLLRDLLEARAALLQEDHPGREEVNILHDILDRNSHALKEDPTLLIQQVVNAREWHRAASGKLGAKVAQAERLVKRPWLRLLNRADQSSLTAPVRTLTGHAAHLANVAFFQNGRMLASADLKAAFRLWDTLTGELLRGLEGQSGGVECVALSPDGCTLASGDRRMVLLWDARSGEQLRALEGQNDIVSCLSFSPDGSTLASGGGGVRLWDARTGELLRHLEGERFWGSCLSFSPDGGALACGGYREVWLWDVRTGERLSALDGHQGEVHCLAFSPDGGTLASASYGEVLLWDARTGEQLRALHGHRGWVNCLSFASDGRALASGADHRGSGELLLWDTRTGEQLGTLEGHRGGVNCLSFSPDGRTLASGGRDRIVRLWDTQVARQPRAAEQPRGWEVYYPWVQYVAFSPDGRAIALDRTSEPEGLRLWNPRTGEHLCALEGHRGLLECSAFSADSGTLAIGYSGKVLLWDSRTGEHLLALRGHRGCVTRLAFSADGGTLASSGRGEVQWEVRLWDIRTWELVLALEGSCGEVNCMAFSPDGGALASGDRDKIVRVWDTCTGQEVAAMEGHRGWVSCLAFSPDGRTLASGGCGVVRLWDVRTGEQLRALEANCGWVNRLAFSPDGGALGCGGDWAVGLWDPRTGQSLSWMPCPDGVLALWWGPTLPRLCCADGGGGTRRPRVHVLELVRP
jgi:WD40 repeat protein